MSNKKYSILYCDVPWSFYNDSTALPDCTTVKGMRRPPYKVMASDEIAALPIQNIVADNALLFMWTTDYHLEKCLKIINSWSFTYKTIGFYWQKTNKKGEPVCFMGAYTMKSGVELCLLATRGKDAHKLVKKHNIRSLITHPRTEHSKKPDEVRDRIVELCGDVPRIEIFGRQRTDGWDVIGNEIDGKDISESLRDLANV